VSVKIDQGFLNEFITTNSAFSIEYSTENITYTPTHDTPYAELVIIQNDITPLSLNDTNETDGVFRIILRYGLDQGSISAKTKADEIMAAFGIGSEIVYGGVTSKIKAQSRKQGFPDDGWYKLVIDFDYKTFLTR